MYVHFASFFVTTEHQIHFHSPADNRFERTQFPNVWSLLVLIILFMMFCSLPWSYNN